MRLYELAKELGLENRAVIVLCDELGIEGKNSHSNSLTDGEAEKIRRHVIRSAVNDKGDSIREVRRSGETVTERRVGGSVIRRRKKDDELDEAPQAPLNERDFHIEPSTPMFANQSPDFAAEQKERNAALRAADALFAPKKQSDDESDDDEEAELESEEEEDTEESEEEAAEESGEEAVGEEPEELAASAEATAADAQAADKAANAERLAEVRKRLDIRAPKVLGRIELPAKPVREKPATSENGTAASTDDADAAGRKAKKRRVEEPRAADTDARGNKRPKKKQVLRKDQLVDYEGDRDLWRGKRDKGKKGGKGDGRNGSSADQTPLKVGVKMVRIDGEISVGEFARQLGVKAGQVIAKLMHLGVMATINQLIDFETATIVAEEFGAKTQNTESDSEAFMAARRIEGDDPDRTALRPPIVTVMGHVDHGKTSLLDSIRKTSVTAGEVGGITQHIGAYNVKLASGGSVTFLDTPGHEAFTAMRMRGAQLTDIVVLVVAADDGVMPQTIEAINHAKAADVPIIVAINKMDKDGANPEKVINQLSEHGLVPEEWGGETIMVKVSAHTKAGIPELLENLHVQAEVLELKADVERAAYGTVVESKLDRGRGTVITLLVQGGTLRKGDAFVAGPVFGRVKALVSDDGTIVDSAGPSIPVEVLGASSGATAGDDFAVISDEVRGRAIADERAQKRRRKELTAMRGASSGTGPLTLEQFSQMVGQSSEMKELPLIVKADVQGSAEALGDTLMQLSNSEVRIKIIHKAVGGITENDVQLASASNAIIVAFNVRPDSRANLVLESEGVEMVYSRVIYDLIDSIKSAIVGRMAPKFQEKVLGHVEVRQTFKVPRLGMIAGSYVLDGTITRAAQVRLLRDGAVMFEGKLASLRRFKDDVREVNTGYECGIGLDGFSDIKDGDMMEVFTVEEIKQTFAPSRG